MSEIKTVISPDTVRAERVPPHQRLTDRFPVLHYGAVQRIDPTQWRLAIRGLVCEEVVLNWTQFNALPRTRLFCDIHCVTGWSKLGCTFEGVSARDLCDLAGIAPEARFVVVHGAGDFTTNLTLDDFAAEDVLLALGYEGAPLTPEHGYPVRLIVPRLYFWKSAKWVTGIEFVRQDRPGFWESHGYHNHGDPWSEERYS
jgi:DMSO/TMAO reductase YedYZ molybdopterin-dependent catalytic subunit